MLFSIAPALILSALAFPTLRRRPGVPAHMNEEEAKAAYNSSSLHIRQQSLCQSITLDQLNAMGDALQDAKASNYATANWGGDWDTIAVNPPEVCVFIRTAGTASCYPDPMTFTANWSSDPTCSRSSTKFTGYIGASTTVETSTQLGSSTQFTAGVTIGIPETADFSFSVSGRRLYTFTMYPAKIILNSPETVSVDLTNTKGSTTQTTNDARTTVQDTVTCDGPANVEVDVDMQTCTAQGNVDFPVTLGGWVWFYYGSRRSGHYKCSYLLRPPAMTY
ncbi:uncharacterized protein EI90DRAFT_3020592 [Cantharellus anzutake]|uniref:uncharacterized protein n=1 Tax=Cantharellus anzutake TaxID=1750568 RepID=UPI0019067812|nr:uncharacterized protein EI90DRAFT_3020592 [Cantharellus anzutake]KAF8320182.1 hypothetical protein EI90DRAFT_3020592 [Cantharellus anzutake]